ncbi:type II toxin-antitoxin system YafQ family toxin [Peptoniphilus sp. AGMB00490]|uniref:Type II toxin-antitoxin system YafQ family toxin n=1 Tax=Peptoniphilus faecalis TaxID=2731255 RepID=A0A848R4Q6_9FIRM|nr:type II toxin-antitoxin system YafQ family toxin [Peptoniphilus faecalis]NMW84227.1 type II toxin-antitoxin system YafQ family toxin [Peptoniphilus faecalis]
MLKIYQTNRFKKSLKKIRKRKEDISELRFVIGELQNLKTLDKKYLDHELKGDYIGYRECHVKNDLLLVYKIEKDILVLELFDLGTHSDLF